MTQTKVGWRAYVNPISSLLTSIYGVWNGDDSPNDSVSANHGTLVNGTTFTDGKIGKAFTFDGVNDHITLPDDSLNFTGPFSYSFWIKSSDTTNYTIIVGNIQSARAPYGFLHGYEFWLAAGKIQTDYKSGINIGGGGTSVGSISNNTWNHVVVTYNPDNAITGDKIYINGTLDKSSATLDASGITSIHYTTPMKACIGARNQSGSPVNFLPNGTSLDALSVWNKELTSTEITELYNSGTGKQYPY